MRSACSSREDSPIARSTVMTAGQFSQGNSILHMLRIKPGQHPGDIGDQSGKTDVRDRISRRILSTHQRSARVQVIRHVDSRCPEEVQTFSDPSPLSAGDQARLTKRMGGQDACPFLLLPA
jgi:hypothetical protein